MHSSKSTTKPGIVRQSTPVELDWITYKPKNVWTSRISNITVDIEFTDLIPLMGSLRSYHEISGLYAIYCIPDIETVDLKSIPVVSEHCIYIGMSSAYSEHASVLKRISEFRNTVLALDDYHTSSPMDLIINDTKLPKKLHAGASAFYKDLQRLYSCYGENVSPSSVIRNNLYVRVAQTCPEWKVLPDSHEVVLLTEMSLMHPDMLYNTHII